MSSLYRKYRPSNFSEVSGQTHIIKTLSNSIKNDRIAHAYLFTGPRGTGKTTLARIFAKAVNCLQPGNVGADLRISPTNQDEPRLGGSPLQQGMEPCNQCSNCKVIGENRALDLIEIDAASNTGVDNIRQLKETVVLPPNALKYKIYIIDEVHMLSIGAFNALLKTLEEPPSHAIFILATTELHKIPETILSRCQRFDFSRLNQEQIIERLKSIAQKENVEIDDESLETIALEAEGGMRDAESLLGQIIALEDKKISAQEVNEILGTSSKRLAVDFLDSVISDNVETALEKIEETQVSGVNLKNFNKNILSYLRSLLLLKANPANTKLVSNLTGEQLAKAKKIISQIDLGKILLLTELFQKSLSGFKDSPIPQLPLEMAVIEYHINLNQESGIKNHERNTAISNTTHLQQPLSSESSEPKKKPLLAELLGKTKSTENPLSPLLENGENLATINPPLKKGDTGGFENNETIDQYDNSSNISIESLLDNWARIVESTKTMNHSVHAALKNCVPLGIADGQIYIKSKYALFKDKLNEPANRLTVGNAIAKIIQGRLKVFFITEKEAESMKFENSESEKGNHTILHDAMQILGGRIVE